MQTDKTNPIVMHHGVGFNRLPGETDEQAHKRLSEAMTACRLADDPPEPVYGQLTWGGP